MGLADLTEVRRLLVELQRFTEDERTIMSLPRIFQVWGVAALWDGSWRNWDGNRIGGVCWV